jgi:hypothetical protein
MADLYGEDFFRLLVSAECFKDATIFSGFRCHTIYLRLFWRFPVRIKRLSAFYFSMFSLDGNRCIGRFRC